MNFKKLLLVISVIIASMFGLMLATSYAWYSFDEASTTFDAVTSSKDVSVTYQGGEYINTEVAIPLSNDEINEYSDKANFNIKVKKDDDEQDVMVVVSLVNVSIDSMLQNTDFKLDLYYQGSKIDAITGIDVNNSAEITFDGVVLNADNSNLFELRVYLLDNGGNQNEMMGKTFSAKIKVDVVSRLKPIVEDYNGADIYVSSITIDGSVSNSLPNSGYYNMVSSCTKGSSLSWDTLSKTITYGSGSTSNDICSLTFTSSTDYPLLNTMEVGSYVKYVGKGGTVGNTNVACQTNGNASSSTESAETEAPNSCSGQNAREDLDDSGYTRGYCAYQRYKFLVTGWRIAYIDSTGKPVIVSAGSPECNTRESSTANESYIKLANTKALKYCNSDLVDGSCSCIDSDSDGYCDSASSDAWAINDTDFYYMTKAISGYGKRLTSGSSSLGDSGGSLGTTLYCIDFRSKKECGYGNDLIDNGGFYWFASCNTTSNTYGVTFESKHVVSTSSAYAYGLRPVISLSSTVKVTGGSGTMDDPYTISK